VTIPARATHTNTSCSSYNGANGTATAGFDRDGGGYNNPYPMPTQTVAEAAGLVNEEEEFFDPTSSLGLLRELEVTLFCHFFFFHFLFVSSFFFRFSFCFIILSVRFFLISRQLMITRPLEWTAMPRDPI
jgi:hypothetical protein